MSRLAELPLRKRFLLATIMETLPKRQELFMPVPWANTARALQQLARPVLLVTTKDRRHRPLVPRARLAVTATVVRHRVLQHPRDDTCPFLVPRRRSPSARDITTHTLVTQ